MLGAAFSALKGVGKTLKHAPTWMATGQKAGTTIPLGANMPTLNAATMGYFGMPFTYDIGKAGVQAAGKSFSGKKPLAALKQAKLEFEELQRQAAKSQQQQMQQQMAQQQGMSRNIAGIAATNPHLYNQILAGRTLPQGSVVLGGRPRTDLLEQFARQLPKGQPQGQMGQQAAPQGGAFFQDLASQPF